MSRFGHESINNTIKYPFILVFSWNKKWFEGLVTLISQINSDPHKCMSIISRLVDIILKIIMRVMWFAGGFHWMTVKGRRALPAEAPILTLAPHSSYFDAIPVTMTMASIVMKAESKDIPLWGSKYQTRIYCCHCYHHVL